MKLIIRFLLALFFISLCYIIGIVAYATMTDFDPPEVMPSEVIAHSEKKIIKDSILNFATWNVGYGGLGENMGFFYSGGAYLTSGDKRVRQDLDEVQTNIAGTLKFLDQSNVDFYLFQEVDVDSKRSHYIDQLDLYAKAKPDYACHLSTNFDVQYLPIPILEFWNTYGKALSGLGTLSRYEPVEANRLTLPGRFDWPDYTFQLDRCIGYFKYQLANGKSLVVLNIHNSAYDKGGVLKKQQVAFFKDLAIKEYEAGNYVVAGGDWNQVAPTVSPDLFWAKKLEEPTTKHNMDADLFPADWQWAYDTINPTCRSSSTPFVKGKSRVTLIDYFLVSPNVEVLKTRGINMDFKYSDHQPVFLKVRLK